MTDPPHRILVVEDDDDTRQALAVVLELAGIAVAAAWGVEDGLRHIRGGFRPCVVLLDLHMSQLSGWDFLERMPIEPYLVDVPAIVFSGDHDQRRRVREAGCEFLAKPAESSVVLATIARRCRRHPMAA